jgi:hypothetical protein
MPCGCNELEPRLIWIKSNAHDTKTIIEMPDGLCRQADAEAAMGGRKRKDAPRKIRQKPCLADLMKRAQGMIDSGIPDLASNPGHLKSFGRNAAIVGTPEAMMTMIPSRLWRPGMT